MARCDSYIFGECTWGACEYAGWVPEGLGNAGDWTVNALDQGYQLTMSPTQGAIVVYAKGDGYSSFGHCGVVIDVGVGDQFLVHEMNYVAWNEYDDRWSSMYDVAGFILPPGVAPGSGGPPAPGGGGPSNDDLFRAWGSWAELQNINGPNSADYWRAQNAQIDRLG